LGDPEALKRLNAVVWPLVGAARAGFIERAEATAAPFAVFDIPLLYETGGEKSVDVVVVVSAPADVQRERVLARPGMTQQKLDAILAAQKPDAEKRAKADFVIETGAGLEAAKERVDEIIAALRARAKQANGGT
jgi:dephospho-CoA kinase